MHKAERPSKYFFQLLQIKKGVICVQIVLEIHQTEHDIVHFQGGTTSINTTVLVVVFPFS